MVKIIALLLVLATGQTARLEYATVYDTNAQCEAAKVEAEAVLYQWLKERHDLDRADVQSVLTCDGEDAKDGDDTSANGIRNLLVKMNSQGGMARVGEQAKQQQGM